MLKILPFFFALIVATFAMYTPFWDDFSHSDYGLKMFAMDLEFCHSFPCVLPDGNHSHASMTFIAMDNYDIGNSIMIATVTSNGLKAILRRRLTDVLHIVSNDADGDVTTLNSGGIYVCRIMHSDLGLFSEGRYKLEPEIILDKNNDTSVISKFHTFFARN